jgi:N-dimethylarginine dimethylaminohydrolase
LKTTKLTNFSAYGGSNYQLRTNEDSSTFHTEYNRLRAVTIFIPGKEIHLLKNPDRVQHLDKIDYKKMQKELKIVKSYFRKMKIKIIEIERNHSPPKNLCFTRDLFWMGPKGIIQARMGSEIRKKEENLFLKTVANQKLNFHFALKSPCLFEGADALWLDSQTIVIGIKNRTNKHTVSVFKKIFSDLKIFEVNLPKQVQHLLGLVQLIDKKKALLRYKIAPLSLKKILKKYNYNIINIDEIYEVTHLQAMNIVTIRPNTIIMPDDCPLTEKFYLNNEIYVDSKFNIQELRKAGGGLACAIGILKREN